MLPLYAAWYAVSRVPALGLAIIYRRSEYWHGWEDGLPLMSRFALFLVPGVGELMLLRMAGIMLYNITHPQTP